MLLLPALAPCSCSLLLLHALAPCSCSMLLLPALAPCSCSCSMLFGEGHPFMVVRASPPHIIFRAVFPSELCSSPTASATSSACHVSFGIWGGVLTNNSISVTNLARSIWSFLASVKQPITQASEDQEKDEDYKTDDVSHNTRLPLLTSQLCAVGRGKWWGVSFTRTAKVFQWWPFNWDCNGGVSTALISIN